MNTPKTNKEIFKIKTRFMMAFELPEQERVWNWIETNLTEAIAQAKEVGREEMELINGDKIENTWEAGIKTGREQVIVEIKKKLPSHKGKMLARSEVKKILQELQSK